MHILKWWRIYPLEYKAIGALMFISSIGTGVLVVSALLYFASNMINTMGTAEMNSYLYWLIALVVVVGLPFVWFTYLDWSRKREREGDIENDARLKEAVTMSKSKLEENL